MSSSGLTVPLSWKLSVQGAGEIKNRLNELNSAFDRNEISASNYAKELRRLNTDARSLTQTTTLQKNIFLATHPTFNAMSRATSTLASASRGLLAVLNAVNLARLASQGTDSRILEARAEEARILREIARTADPEKLQELNEALGITRARLEELVNDKAMQGIEGILISLGSFAIIGKSALDIVSKLGPSLARIGSISIGSGGGLAALFGGLSAGAIAAVAAAIAAVAAAVFVWVAAVEKALGIDGPFSAALDGILENFKDILGPITKAVIGFFTITLPRAVGMAALALSDFFLITVPQVAQKGFALLLTRFTEGWNFIIDVTQQASQIILDGIEAFINGFVTAINVLISAYNAAAAVLGLPKIQLLKHVDLGNVELGRLKISGQDSGGQGQPSPTGAGASGTGGVTIVNNIQGSVLSERELQRLTDDSIKQTLKDSGFTGI